MAEKADAAMTTPQEDIASFFVIVVLEDEPPSSSGVLQRIEMPTTRMLKAIGHTGNVDLLFCLRPPFFIVIGANRFFVLVHKASTNSA